MALLESDAWDDSEISTFGSMTLQNLSGIQLCCTRAVFYRNSLVSAVFISSFLGLVWFTNVSTYRNSLVSAVFISAFLGLLWVTMYKTKVDRESHGWHPLKVTHVTLVKSQLLVDTTKKFRSLHHH